jgi:hypothetical protein
MHTIISFYLIDFIIKTHTIKTDNTNRFHCPFGEGGMANLTINQKLNHK